MRCETALAAVVALPSAEVVSRRPHLRPTLNVKLARMLGADLFTEPAYEDQDDSHGDDVHELCNHEHGIADDDRMTEKER
jgi:hypothetical protein